LRGILRCVDEDDEEDEEEEEDDEEDDVLKAEEGVVLSTLADFGSFPPGGVSDARRRFGKTVLIGFGLGPLSPV
jgi:hypothetical protein